MGPQGRILSNTEKSEPASLSWNQQTRLRVPSICGMGTLLILARASFHTKDRDSDVSQATIVGDPLGAGCVGGDVVGEEQAF